MDELSKLFAIMEAQETRLLGIAHCIVPKEEEIPIIEPVFVAPAATKDIEKSTPHSEKLPASVLIDDAEKQDSDPLVDTEVRVLETPSDVPSVILSSLSKSVVTEEPIKEIIATTTDIPIPNPNENDINIVTYTDKLIVLPAIPVAVAETSSVENDTVLNALNYINKLENVTVLETTPITTNHNSLTHSATENFETTSPSSPSPPSSLSSSSSSSSSSLLSSTTSALLSSLSPPLSSSTPSPSPSSTSLPLPNQSTSTSPPIAEIVLGEMESVSKSPESDNYIYETFSPVSPVNISAISSFHRNDHLVLAEEPPEIPNDAVSVA